MRRLKTKSAIMVEKAPALFHPITDKRQLPYQSLGDLNHDLKELMLQLPTDIDLVVGIPRCGMIPATLIAMYWNLPLTDLYTFCRGELYKNLVDAQKYQFSRVQKVLVIDDTAASGRNMTFAKKLIKASGLKFEFVYAVVYATRTTRSMVDYYHRIIPMPRIHEWDLAQDKSFSEACVDIDGVLCRDPTKEEKSSPEKLAEFYRTVNPWIKPVQLDTIITGRLERYRPETEEWLAKNGIKYNKLIMLSSPQDHAQFKADIFSRLPNKLFVESSPREASIIAKTGKQTIVPFREQKKLNILTHIRGINVPAGASITICVVSGALSQKGHTVEISQSATDLPYVPRDLSNLMVSRQLSQLYNRANIVLVHWRASLDAIRMVRRIPRPRVHFFCDRGSPERLGVRDAALLVFNSYWLMEDTGWTGEQMVVYPPVYPEYYRTTPGDGILLVAPHETKGIGIFIELARRMPGRRFILARGRGIIPPQLPSNVEVIGRTPDPREIYSQARIALMPSREGQVNLNGRMAMWVEGYGRVAIEAAASGIPTIASRESAGLRECLGEGGMFAGQDDIDEWIDLIEKLDNKDFYDEKSEYALKLSKERHPDRQINELEGRLIDICNRS